MEKEKTEVEIFNEERKAFHNYMRNVMHDLRSPLATIIGYQNLILDGDNTPEEIIEFTQITNDISHKMFKMMEFYLLLEKIERGKKAVEMDSFTIVEVVNTIKKVIYDVNKDNKVVFVLDHKEIHNGLVDYKRKILINEILISSLLTNLLENAMHSTLSYEEVSKIIINIYEKDNNLMISIINQGEIPADIKNKIFEKFSTSKKNGNGLGLYISKTIAEVHHGDLVYEPLEGKTKFILKIPFK
ncbi:MAG: HAMP domain-containing sensor histidine kinase [Candidatus Nomurabacteria bacterium]